MIAAVVLAAGAATRFGAPKQELLLPHVLARVGEAPVDDVVVVIGAYDVAVGDARAVSCPAWEDGPGASLRCGLQALADKVEAAIVCLADGPLLSGEAIARVIAVWRSGAGPVVAASYGGERGHPVLLAREVWGSIPDAGARAFDPVLVPCDDLGSPEDVDTVDDLRRIEERLGELP